MFDRGEMSAEGKNGQRRLRDRVVQLARHLNRRGIVFLSDDDCHGHAERREMRADVDGTQQRAGRGIAVEVGGHEDRQRPLKDFRVTGAEVVGEPARRLEVEERGHALGACRIRPLLELRRGILAVPRRGIDEAQRVGSRRIQPREREDHAPTHRATGQRGVLPPDVIEQLGEIPGEEIRCERSGPPVGSPMTAAVVGEDLRLAPELPGRGVPDAAIEGQ